MAEPLLRSVDLSRLTLARIWASLDRERRKKAAAAFYEVEARDSDLRRGADGAIAAAIRFRPESVRKLPAEKKAVHLATAVRPEEPLAAMLLQSYHLQHARPLLGAFLDALGIPHQDGHIDDEAKVDPPKPEALAGAAEKLYGAFPGDDVDLYLLTLVAMDPAVWGGLHGVLAGRAKT